MAPKEIVIAVSFVSCAALAAPPFGLRMGMTFEDIKVVVPLKSTGRRFEYVTDAPPNPDEVFAKYYLFVAPKYGLCRVLARTGGIKTDPAGMEYRKHYSEMETRLVASFGPWTRRVDGPLLTPTEN